MIINPSYIQFTPVMALDLETNGLDPNENDVLIIALRNEAGREYVIERGRYEETTLIKMLKPLEDCEVVIAHNAKFDTAFMYTNFGMLLRNIHCTMLASQILENHPTRVNHTLSAVLYKYCGKTLKYANEKSDLQKSFVGQNKQIKFSRQQLEYAAEDVAFLHELYRVQMRRIERDKMQSVLKLENTLVPVIVKMEVQGCLINKQKWEDEIKIWVQKRDAIKLQLDEEILSLVDRFNLVCGISVSGKQFYLVDMFRNTLINYSSDAQIKNLFLAVGEKPPVDKHDKVSTSEDSLKTYVNEHPDSNLIGFLKSLLLFREYDKLVSTYGDSFLERLDKNNHIHTNYTQCRTKTGRLSSTNPNLQNIPSRGDGSKIREFFIPADGNVFITCDMAGAEIAIAADYSKEPLLLGALEHGEDMHSKLASVAFTEIFEQPVTVSKSHDPITIKGHSFIPNDLRTVNKSVTFAKFYKAGANRIYQVLAEYINKFHPPSKRIKIAKKVSDALDAEMPVLSKYLDDKIKEGTTKGLLRGSKLGRIRYFDPTAYGQCANFPIQNTNAEALKIALINVDKMLDEEGVGRLVMNIHDEVVVECPAYIAPRIADRVKKIMSDSLSYFLTTIKGGASVNINDHWEK